MNHDSNVDAPSQTAARTPGARSAGRGQAASFAGDPALGDQSRERTEESAGEKSQSGPRSAREHAPRQPARQLTPAEQHDLAARIKAGDQVAREALIVANLGLVANIARRYYSYGATLDDLIQEGSRGLITPWSATIRRHTIPVSQRMRVTGSVTRSS